MSDVKDWVSETRARCEAATEGPWRWPDDGTVGTVECRGGDCLAQVQDHLPGSRVERQERRQENARFIASARTDLPRALSVVEAADALAKATMDLVTCHLGDDEQALAAIAKDALAAYRSVRK